MVPALQLAMMTDPAESIAMPTGDDKPVAIVDVLLHWVVEAMAERP